jgi:hypothetical protein
MPPVDAELLQAARVAMELEHGPMTALVHRICRALLDLHAEAEALRAVVTLARNARWTQPSLDNALAAIDALRAKQARGTE